MNSFNSCSSSSGDSHGDHVSGTIMGAEISIQREEEWLMVHFYMF